MKNIKRCFLLLLLIACCVYLIGLFSVFRVKKKENTMSWKEADLLLETLFTEGGWQIPEEDEISWNETEEIITRQANQNEILKNALNDQSHNLYMGMQKMKKEYQNQEFVKRDDWYGFFNLMCSFLYPENEVEVINILMIKDTEDGILTNHGVLKNDYEYKFNQLENYKIVKKDRQIITIWEKSEEEQTLKNVWLMYRDKEKLHFWYQDNEIEVANQNLHCSYEQGQIDRVADMVFKDGKIKTINNKEQIETGKILQRTKDTILIKKEEEKEYLLSPDLQIYQIYGCIRNRPIESATIGYEYGDFIIQDGRIEAILLTQEEHMKTIRVLIKNNENNSFFYPAFQCTSKYNFEVQRGDEIREYQAGEEFELTSKEIKNGERLIVRSANHTGSIQCNSIIRSQGAPTYEGIIEITAREEGLLIINEILLENYLYTVVPSEMPSYYPIEALKAQAICARTYAYHKMLYALYPEYGAHLDDTTTCQVYQNYPESVESKQAVDATFGEVLVKEKEPVETFYYSTSCGFGTTEEIWGNGKKYDYLQAGVIRKKDESNKDVIEECKKMQDEEFFREYIRKADPNDYEVGEPWYRWSYHEKLNCGNIQNRLENCYRRYPDKIKVAKTSEDIFIAMDIPQLLEIDDIVITKRLPGGIAHEMVIYCGKVKIQVQTEQLIRTILPEPGSEVMRQDGSRIAISEKLPSAFLYVNVEKSNNEKAVYIAGGGYGHGVGMSQNGAAGMARSGVLASDILSSFYYNTEIEKLYDERNSM